MTRTHSRQHGQIVIIFAGGLLLMMAIAALVIDIGFAFMLRRQEQNAADPGAIAAARYIPTADTVQMRVAACFYARQNGFFPDPNTTCDTALDPAGTTLSVNYPPSAGAGDFSGHTDKVEVRISRAHRSFFAGALGMATIPVSTSAVAAFSNGNSNTNSLIALDKTGACATAKVHGTGDVNIFPIVPGTDGGYIHVNSTCATAAPDATCDNGSGALKIDGTATITAPHTYVTGSCQAQNGLFGPLTEGAVQIGDPLAELANAPPQIADYPPGQCGPTGIVTAPTGPNSGGCRFGDAGTVLLQPGVYYGGWEIKNNVTLELAPGVYIIAGGGIKLTGTGSITSVQGGAGAPAPVLFFNTDNPATGTGQAPIDFTAQSTLKLRAIDTGPYRGILLWNDGKGSNPTAEISLGGQTSLDIGGTIYNPLGHVKLEGGSGVGSTAAIQIIANTFDVGGNASLDMPYDPNGLYQFDRKGLVR